MESTKIAGAWPVCTVQIEVDNCAVVLLHGLAQGSSNYGGTQNVGILIRVSRLDRVRWR